MLDIKLIRERPDFVKGELAKRGVDPAEVDRLLDADQKRRKLQAEGDKLRPDRKRRAKGETVEASNPLLVLAKQMVVAEKSVEELALTLPNIPRPYVVVGASEADNRVIKTEGTPTEFTSFKPLPHWELGENLGIIDFDRGVKLSGTRFYVLSGAGARLQRALIAWMLDVKTREQGYLEIIPPLMVSTETATSTGHLPKNADTMYRDIEDDFWFIPTAEVPLTSLHRDETLDENRLPIYMTAYTPCFRREKMSAGRDVRGTKRGNRFNRSGV